MSQQGNDNFIMSNKLAARSHPQSDATFSKQNRTLNRQQHRLDIEIIRVHAIQKQKKTSEIWNLTQQDLCDFFTHYDLFPQADFTLAPLLESQYLKLVKAQGQIYFGEVVRGRREGMGITTSRDGRVFEGHFLNNSKSGFGVEIYPNGNVYIGCYENGKKHHQGKFYWFNLSAKSPKQNEIVEYYDGFWWGGLPDGLGTHQKINGDLYTGQFKNGLKHGQGREWYGNGDFYKGDFVNGMPEGYGEYNWAEGSSFKGDFRQGSRNGYGVWKAGPQGRQSYKGHYVMDKKSGYGIYCWDNGWKYRGNFDNDFRNGYGELYDGNDCLIYRGFWENGEQTLNQPIISSGEHEIDFQDALGKNQYPQGSLEFQTKSQRSYSSNKFKKIRQEELDPAELSKTVEIRMRKRPFSHQGAKGNLKQGPKKSREMSGSQPRVSRGLVGTIKSNLFVVCPQVVAKAHS